jgi:hypothetical protein
MVPCWIQDVKDDKVFFLADTSSGLNRGDKVLLTVDGERASLMICEVVDITPSDSWMRYEAKLTQEPVKAAPGAEKRLLATGLKGRLHHLDYENEVKVFDISTSGAGIICNRAFNQNALVSIDLIRGEQRVKVRGRVRYSIPLEGGDFRCGIQFLSSNGIDKSSLTWLAEAA